MKVLFAGAHPDDIELGASVLARRTTQLYDTRFLICSDEPQPTGNLRRAEAQSSASLLGLQPPNITFLGLRDGYISVDKSAVAWCRSQLKEWRPDIVVTHSVHDSHQDHRHCNELLRATCRRSFFLCYYAPLSGESSFLPSWKLLPTDDESSIRHQSLHCFISQRHRLIRSHVSFEYNVEKFESFSQQNCDLRRFHEFVRNVDLASL